MITCILRRSWFCQIWALCVSWITCNHLLEMMANSGSWIWYNFFLSLFFTILSTLFFLFPRKANGRCECFYHGKLASPTCCCSSVCKICKFVFYVLNLTFNVVPQRETMFSQAVVSSCFYIKGVLTNFLNLTWKQLCQSLFLNKVAGIQPVALLEKRLWHRWISVNIAKFLRTPLLRNSFRHRCIPKNFLKFLRTTFL